MALLAASCGGDEAPTGGTAVATTPTTPTTATTPSDPAAPSGPGAAPGAAPGAVDAADPGVLPEGFTTVRGEITDAAGEVCEVCLWLADSPDERSRGLMGVTDLGGADGMVFTWASPSQGNFYMYRTPTPLSIAWFAPDGSFVAAADMEPCLTDSRSDCERYGPGTPYTAAVEVFRGGLDDLGVGPGSTLRLLPDTESPTCTP